MKWTIAEAIPIAQSFEPVAVQYNAHIALGGSVLYNGQSDNDLDFIIYPHTGKGLTTDFISCIKALPGVQNIISCSQYQEEENLDQKEIWVADIRGKKVNFICLLRWEEDEE